MLCRQKITLLCASWLLLPPAKAASLLDRLNFKMGADEAENKALQVLLSTHRQAKAAPRCGRVVEEVSKCHGRALQHARRPGGEPE